MKTENEFRAVSELDWAHGDTPAAWQRILSQDPDDPQILTRLVRWDPGYDSSAGVGRLKCQANAVFGWSLIGSNRRHRRIS